MVKSRGMLLGNKVFPCKLPESCGTGSRQHLNGFPSGKKSINSPTRFAWAEAKNMLCQSSIQLAADLAEQPGEIAA